MLQTEYHRPTPECLHPERWRMFDSMTAEVEVLEFLQCLVTTVKPQLVLRPARSPASARPGAEVVPHLLLLASLRALD